MPEVSRLSVAVVADNSDLKKGMSESEGLLKGFGSSLSSVFAGIGMGIGSKVFDTITAGLGAIKSAAIDLNSSLEQSKIAFTTMLGSAEAADQFLGELQQFAAKTPFEFPDLVDASKRMFAFGFESKQVVPLLTAVGDAVAAVGGGADVINGVTLALGQMKAKGKVSAEEMGQLAERGIPAWDMLAKKLGVDVPQAMEMVSKGAVKADTFIAAFQEGVATRFGGMMEKQAVTFQGAMSTIKDSLSMATATAFQPFFKLLSEGAVVLANFLQSDTFSGWAQSISNAIAEAARITGDAFRTIKQVFEGDWQPSESIDPIVNSIGMIATAIKSAYDIASTVIPQIIATFQTLFALFQGEMLPVDELMTLGTTLDEIFGPAMSAMILDFVRLAGEAWREFSSSAMELIGGVVDWFKENFPLIEQVGRQVVAGLAKMWEENGANIVTIVQSVWEIVKTVIAGAADIIGSVVRAFLQLMTGDVSGAMTTLGGLIERTWGRLQQITAAAWAGIVAAIDIVLQGSISSITQWVDQVGQDIESGYNTLIETVTSSWESIKSSIDSALTSIQDAIRAVWELIPEDIRSDCEKILSVLVERGAAWVASLVDTGQNMLTTLTTKLQEILAYVQTWATTSILEPLQTLIGTSTTTAESIGSGIFQGLMTKLDTIGGAISSWANSTFLGPLQSLIGTARDTASSIGEAIIEGIMAGARSMASSLSGVLGSIVRSALASAKDALGIDSPSKVFADEVGKPIGMGVIQGAEGTEGDISKSLASLVQVPQSTGLSPVSTSGLASSGPGLINNITIYFQGHALIDKRAIADAVVAGLEAAQQQSRLRVRVV